MSSRPTCGLQRTPGRVCVCLSKVTGPAPLRPIVRPHFTSCFYRVVMKIIEDKVKVYPPHAICRADVPKIMSAVPPEWVAEIKIVRLSAANPHPHVTIYNPFDHILTIKSRG